MSDSILTSTKKVLGLEEDYTAFDVDVLMHINTVFSTLSQIGIGPSMGFMIEDKSATWTDFLGQDLNLNSVKTYIFLKVKLAFDPPATSFHIAAMENQIREIEWRLNVHRETTAWALPVPLAHEYPDEDIIHDGGSP